jgi:ABC-2 type transport system ATP-binding protein
MKQKLAIARALLHRPSLLFLDEPTAGLDPRAAFALRAELADLVASDGITVFLTTHNLAEAEHLCSLIAVIRAGRLVAVGSPSDLRRGSGQARVDIVGRRFDSALAAVRAHPDVRAIELIAEDRLRVDLMDDATIGPVIASLVASGAVVEEAIRPRASLEDVFLSLTETDA